MKTQNNLFRKVLLCCTLFFLWIGVVPGQQSDQQSIVLLKSGASIDSFLQRNKARLVKKLGKDLPDVKALLIAPADGSSGDQLGENVSTDSDVVDAEPNSTLVISENSPARSGHLNQSTVALLNQSTVALLNDSTVTNFYGVNVKSSYARQPALALIRSDEALRTSTGRGIIIADIDTGVDTNSPILSYVLTEGYNFIDNNTNVSEWAGLDPATGYLLNQNYSLGLDQSTVSLLNQSTVSLLNQSTVALLNQSTVALLNQSSVALLNQSTVAMLNQSTVALLNQSTVALLNQLPPSFGHGTMVAGLIHVVAPYARIQPLKAFRPDGTGTLFNVIQAIQYAADHDVDVINMSFSFSGDSKVLHKVIDYARSKGVILVSSMGNEGLETTESFPAAYQGVVGIAATDNQDVIAPFSNYGKTVSYTAPGVSLVTIFPGGHYALVSGTSFSSALVSGLAALGDSICRWNQGEIYSAMSRGAVNIDLLNPSYVRKLGKGRVDAAQTLIYMLGN